MTVLRDAFPVEFPALVRVSGELCLLPRVRRQNFFGNSSERAFDPPETLRVPSRLRLQPRATLSLTGKNPFNPQYA
jgi:hypothetical protein